MSLIKQLVIRSNRTSQRSTKNYELDKTISHTRNRAGAVKRLAVAVVLNNKITTGKNKKVKEVPYTQQELERITTLVRQTVGFNVLRGDSVNVINVPFTKIEFEEIPEEAIYEQAWVWDAFYQN